MGVSGMGQKREVGEQTDIEGGEGEGVSVEGGVRLCGGK